MISHKKTLFFKDNDFHLDQVFINGISKEYVWVKNNFHCILIEENEVYRCYIELANVSEIYDLLEVVSQINCIHKDPLVRQVLEKEEWGVLSKSELEQLVIEYQEDLIGFLQKNKRNPIRSILKFWT